VKRGVGIGLTSCILPAIGHPNFDIKDGTMEVGIGHHGEPGIEVCPLETAARMAKRMVDVVVPDHPFVSGDKVVVLLSGLGATFIDMAEAAGDAKYITPDIFLNMVTAGLDGLCSIVEAKVGDKTLIDTLSPAKDALEEALKKGCSFALALEKMKDAAETGRDSTKDMVAKFGRSSRLGERSKGVLDAGAASCFIILSAMAESISELAE